MPREYSFKTLVSGYVPTEQLRDLQTFTGLNRSQLIAHAFNALESKLERSPVPPDMAVPETRPQLIDIASIEPDFSDLPDEEYPHLYYRNGTFHLDPEPRDEKPY